MQYNFLFALRCNTLSCNCPNTVDSEYATYIFPPSRLIRMSSPNLNYLIGGGAIILYVDIYFFTAPTTNPHAVTVLCNLTPWLTALGYSLCYGTILAKMVRVYYIFDKPTPQKRKVKLEMHSIVSSTETEKCHHEQ